MNRKLSITLAAALLSAPLLAGPASATEGVCVPAEAYTETIQAETEVVVVTPAADAVFEVKWYTHKGGSDDAPAVDSDKWNETNGQPQGKPHENREPGVPYKAGQGKGPWFMWLNVEISPAVEEVTEVVVISPEQIIEHAAVECPVPPMPSPVPIPDEGEVCCAVTVPKDDDLLPPERRGEVGDGGVSRDRLPDTGSGDVLLLALAGLGFAAIGGIAYSIGKRQ